MRIQHNIPAMSAYRNYTNNVSAVNKNLERLSSGYKINRAGDDAAGLAISEKMRAQISGLEQAQSNAKSGINLVQTAEGALTEVHDMLNRMYTLAEQSANGTYDDSVDRVQLQKEVNQLRDEINRIADSSNFNGINLLDGSLSSNGVKSVETAFKLPTVGEILGTNTVLHKDVDESDNTTAFDVELHNVKIEGSEGDTFTLKIGSTTLTGTLQADARGTNALSAADIATALKGEDTSKISFGADYDGSAVMIDGNEYSVNNSGSTATFTLNDTSLSDVPVSMKVSIAAGAASGSSATVSGTAGDEIVAVEADADQKISGTKAAGVVVGSKGAITGTVGNAVTGGAGSNFTLDFSDIDANEHKNAILDALRAAGETGTANDKITVTASNSGADWALKVGNIELKTLTAQTLDTADGAETELDFGEFGKVTVKVAAGNTGDISKLSAAAIESGLSLTTAGAAADGGTIDCSGLNSDAITAAAEAKSIAAGAPITIEKNAGNTDIELKIGINVIGKGTINGTSIDFEDDNGNSLGSVAFTAGGSATLAATTFSTAANTGLQFDPNGIVEVKLDASGLDSDAIAEAAKDANANGDVTISRDATSGDIQLKVGNNVIATGELDDDSKVITFSDADGNTLGTVESANAFDPANITTTVKTGLKVKTESGITVSGDYNVSTTDQSSKTGNSKDRLASTYFDLTKDMVVEGASIKIANETYVFKTDKDSSLTASGNTKVVDVSDLDSTSLDYLTVAARRLTDEAAANTVYTVGYDKNRISVTETTAHADLKPNAGNPNYSADQWDLSTEEGIAESLGFTKAGKSGKALTLQIGDTAESFNKMTVDIKDMHADAMGIGEIDISTQDGASAAMEKIKNAVNYVSDVRGDLGATQNRLDHTINNLSVMQENIQDAESTIRDVDVAKEMMEYTKNNILVQSAQAMLAQANQLPQGVLQLLG